MEDVLIVGAGPCGLAAAIACKRAGLNPINIEKGSLVHSIYRYPTYMIFHSTAELLEIGKIPFTISRRARKRSNITGWWHHEKSFVSTPLKP